MITYNSWADVILVLSQVLWLGLDDCFATWEDENDLPQGVVEEFETKENIATVDKVCQSTGQNHHVLYTSHSVGPPNKKGCARGRTIVPPDQG